MNLKFTSALKESFIQELEDSCSVKHAAAAIGITRDTVYAHKKHDVEFSRKWDAAIERALDDLLGEAHRRATKEKSDRLLEVLLKFRYGDRMADRLAVKVEQSTGLDPDALLQMSAEDRQALQRLLGKYTEAEQQVLEQDDGQTT